MKLGTKFMIYIVILIIAVGIWGYITSSLPAPLPAWHRTSPGAATTSPNTPAEQGPTASVGKSFTFGHLQYVIEKTERSGDITQGSTSLKSAGSFFLVYLTARNQGKQPVSLAPADFALEDSQGREFTLNREATKLAGQVSETGDFLGEALQPGLGRRGVLVFDVPQSASGLTLRLSNGYLDVNLGS